MGVFALVLAALCGSVVAQEVGGAQPPARESLQVRQTLFMDSTAALPFQEVRALQFLPFNGNESQPFQGQTGWIRLSISRAPGDHSPLQLQIIPSVFDEATLFTPSSALPGGWKSQVLDNPAKHPITLDDVDFQQGDMYLRLKSGFDFYVHVYVRNQADALKNDKRQDLLVAVITTLLVVALSGILGRVLQHFSWLAVAIALFLLLIICRIWIPLGYAHSMFGMAQGVLTRCLVPLHVGTALVAGIIYVLLAIELLPGARWLRWFWVWVLLACVTLVLAFFYPGLAIHLNRQLVLAGTLSLALCMGGAAFQEPQSLHSLAGKVAFASLVLTAFIGVNIALGNQGWQLAIPANSASEGMLNVLIVRTFVPLVILLTANWSFDRLRNMQQGRAQAELKLSNHLLQLESKRLETQRQFTAMLSHELKNPLMASQLALGNIKRVLGPGSAALSSAQTIEVSLETINTIIERCAELDRYQQGHMPLQQSRFAVGELLVSLNVISQNERIYVITRQVDDALSLESDLQYLTSVLDNLLSNALKYSSPQSLVELQLAVRQNGNQRFLDFSVSNEAGVAGAPDQERVFQRYYRSEGARQQAGTGQGLWLAHSMAQALGSKLLFKTVGEKIVFEFFLKIA